MNASGVSMFHGRGSKQKAFSPSSHHVAPKSSTKSKYDLGTIEKILSHLNCSHLPVYNEHKVLRLRHTFIC